MKLPLVSFVPLLAVVGPRTSLAVISEAPTTPKMKRILCLHGKDQSGAIMSNKIAGARRKLQRVYDLHFLDGPILLPSAEAVQGSTDKEKDSASRFAWWLRNDDGEHIHVKEAFDYVIQKTEGQSYDALIGFSQGGVLAAAIALTGAIPGIRAVVTAGAPMVDNVFDVASDIADDIEPGLEIPKLHLAGETDAIIPVESIRTLCEKAGSGELIIHEQGHLFPTRAVRVNYMMEFLAKSLSDEKVA